MHEDQDNQRRFRTRNGHHERPADLWTVLERPRIGIGEEGSRRQNTQCEETVDVFRVSAV